ncbi:MAG: sulfotransferase domain-containing protein [Cyanobacteria bacterium P01_A01_bin.83]
MTSIKNIQKTAQIQQKLPNLVIAGVVKGGTTSVYSYLSLHPEICCSAVKETCYFSIYRYGQWDNRYQNSSNPHQQYQQYFAHCQDQKYILEATPGYFEGGRRVAEAIQNKLGDNVKIIIILRNPIDRFLSFFKYKKSMLKVDKKISIEEYIEQCEQLPFAEKVKQENDTYWGIEGGFYAEYLSDWFETFDCNVKVLFFDDLKHNPRLFLKNLCRWLEIDPTIYDIAKLEVENKSVNYKNKSLQQHALKINTQLEKFWRSHPQLKTNLRNFYYALNGNSYKEMLSDEALSYLQNTYSPHNQKLRNLLISQGYLELPTWLINSQLVK